MAKFSREVIAVLKNILIFAPANEKGAIAQLVEQRTENPCVPGSIPGGTTFQKQSECSAVGSALRSGRRGRAFESPHSDTVKDKPLKVSGLSHFKQIRRDEIGTAMQKKRLSLKPWGIALKFLFLHHENILFPND